MGRKVRSALGALLLGTLLAPTIASAPTPPPIAPEELAQQITRYEEDLLFDATTLPPPGNRKQLIVHYEATKHDETAPFLKHEANILNAVTSLYAKHGIDISFLRYVQFRPEMNRIFVRVLDEDQYRAAIPTSSEYIRIFSSGYADPENRTLYVKGWKSDITYEREDATEFIDVSIDTLAHEIGHLLMLPHTDRKLIEPKTRSLMWPYIFAINECATPCSGITPEEERIMHSYLEKGQIYEAYQAAGDFIPYAIRMQQERLRTKTILKP